MKIRNREEYNCTWLDHSPHSPKANSNQEN